MSDRLDTCVPLLEALAWPAGDGRPIERGHSPPDTMISMAEQGKGRFYNVTSPNDLPQIFLKETAVILKSAIYEEPFKPQLRSSSEVVRGIGPGETFTYQFPVRQSGTYWYHSHSGFQEQLGRSMALW